jgi:integrase
MHSTLAGILREWRAQHPGLPAARVVKLPDHPALKLQKTLEVAGIPYRDEAGRYADFHALRHTCLTMVARAGCDLKTLQSIARHSTVSLTMNIYVHPDREREAAAVAALPDFTVTRETEKRNEAQRNAL